MAQQQIVGNKRYSSIANNYPSYQDGSQLLLNSYRWLESRKIDDNADGLWRIHNTIYDLTDFIPIHPGGADWIRFTKGLDITEAFEVHHWDTKLLQPFLDKYKVHEATKLRNFKFTFREDGFYKTFKRRVAQKLSTLDRRPELISKIIIDLLLVATLLTASLAVRYYSLVLCFGAAIALTWTIISAHNFFHQRDNIRMSYFNLSLMSFKEWRISHALSHHMYPNSVHDLEIAFFEPFLCWLPGSKNCIQRYVSWIYEPIFYVLIYVDEFIKRIIISYVIGVNLFCIYDLMPLILPTTMLLSNSNELAMVLKMWLLILAISSTIFGFIGLNAAHHNTETVHDGDPIRSDMDWGIYTLDTVVDNSNLQSSHFITLTHFGQHAMHHLLPTVDHGLLTQISPILFETMQEFETELRRHPWFFHIFGQLKQLARISPKSHNSLEMIRLRSGNT